ncbi:MAG TPA: cytochrome c-type biogenesis protein CcmH [Gemmatimonadales bacterium]|jgi:cytochrome c-type biogenesis protein CcmH|nr:cytochrome c-type biogenesis protein CcmH [Gemmatimonadales bacterium]
MKDRDENAGLGRRAFLRTGLAVLAAPLVSRPMGASMPHMAALLQAPAVQDSLSGRGIMGTVRDPDALGRPRQPTRAGEDGSEIQAIEQRLACNCGCTLDVFTCRTTDFSCTYSPRLHREVLALRQQGLTAQQILDAFVAKYGEKALMAPKPEGFNLAGYFVPGIAIAAAGAALFAVISRRRAALAGAGPPALAEDPGHRPSPEELERLQRALDEVED